MISYSFNILGRFPDETYKQTASRALTVARRASAVDTGAFKSAWQVRLSGDQLIVFSTLRYAKPVELGSIVHRKHQFKIIRALERMGLKQGTLSLGASTKIPTDSLDKDPPDKELLSPIQIIPTLTEQEMRSPALLLRRFQVPKISTRPESNLPRKSILFNRDYLLGILLAISLASGKEEPEVEEEPEPERIKVEEVNLDE